MGVESGFNIPLVVEVVNIKHSKSLLTKSLCSSYKCGQNNGTVSTCTV